jgi:hypothetical protein
VLRLAPAVEVAHRHDDPQGDLVSAAGLDHDRAAAQLAQPLDLRLQVRLGVLGVVVLGVLLEVAEVARRLDALRDRAATRGLELVQLGLQGGEALARDVTARLARHQRLWLTTSTLFPSGSRT